MTSIVIPENSEDFLYETKNRCERLIKNGVWDIEPKRLRAWINNFKTSESKYLCAHLLDALSYRSYEMADSLCDHAVNVIFPNTLAEYPKSLSQWCQKLKSGRSCEICFVAVEGVGSLGRSTAKSGQTVLRRYTRADVLNKVHVVDAGALIEAVEKRKYKTVVFIDDFCGTGSQFKDFFEAFKLNQLNDELTLIYIPFSAHNQGVENLGRDIPRLIVSPVENLCEFHDFFFDKNGTFRGDGHNSSDSMKNFYLSYLDDRGLKTEYPFGFGSLSLSMGFAFSTPNNTLPIYYQENPSWQKLLTR